MSDGMLIMAATLIDFDLPALAAQLDRLGHSPAHAPRILRAFYDADGDADFSKLHILKSLRTRLREEYQARRTHVISRHVSRDGTIKLLVGLASGGAVESVLMPTWRDGVAAGCVSSQIGCAMGCDFCASTRGGFERNLTTAEIVEQFFHLRRAATETGRRLNTLVFMGMGEPMLNLDNVIPALSRLSDPQLGAFGKRQITVSTVGIVPGIEQLARSGLRVYLALSLHAPDDETRSRIVPMNRRYNVAAVMDATKRYVAQTRRLANIEYCLIDGVNDSDAHADGVVELMRGFRSHVNVIPYNPIGASISGVTYARPSDERVERFLEILRQGGVVAHARVTRGDDVAAACGQLRERAPIGLPVARA